MIKFKFGELSRELDFTDAAFCAQLEQAGQQLKADMEKIDPSGTLQSVIKAQCAAEKRFFDQVLGEGASEKMFGEAVNARLCNQAVAAFVAAKDKDLRLYSQQTQKLAEKMGAAG